MREKLALFSGSLTVTLPWPPCPAIDAEEVTAAVKVIMSRELSDVGRGGFIGDMEEKFARHFGMRYAVGFGSGTAAIHGGLEGAQSRRAPRLRAHLAFGLRSLEAEESLAGRGDS